MKLHSNITVMDGKWSVGGVVQKAAKQCVDEESFYVMDIGEIVRRYRSWRKLMPRVEVFYAVKCNPDKMLVRTLSALGAGFDCASRQEIDLVTGIGVAPERIIYANTAKMASHVRHAARMGVATTTFDSSDELIKIKSIMPHAKLVLRIRCDAKVAHILLGTKFGCDPITEAPRLLRMASEQNLDVIGVSFHVGSGTQEFEAYARGIRLCSQLFKVGTELGFNMRLLDIGGGYPGDIKDAINQVSAVVNQALEQYFPDDAVRVIAEPGQYFACAAYTLAACIIAKRQVLENGQRHTMYYMSDGVFGSFMDCVIADKRVTPELVAPCSGERELSSLWGPTCDGTDCVNPSTLLPPLPVGSWLMFWNMGAYTRSIATSFHGFPKAKVRYVVDRRIWSILKESKIFGDADQMSNK